MEISNLPANVFKIMVIKMLTELGRRMDEHSENRSKEMGNMLQDTVTELKNTLRGSAAD